MPRCAGEAPVVSSSVETLKRCRAMCTDVQQLSQGLATWRPKWGLYGVLVSQICAWLCDNFCPQHGHSKVWLISKLFRFAWKPDRSWARADRFPLSISFSSLLKSWGLQPVLYLAPSLWSLYGLLLCGLISCLLWSHNNQPADFLVGSRSPSVKCSFFFGVICDYWGRDVLWSEISSQILPA